jgi:hypothetical protein
MVQLACTLLAHLHKSLIINGAGEGNRTLISGQFVALAKPGLDRELLFLAGLELELESPKP